MSPPDPCAMHSLRAAHSPTAAAGGHLVYLICGLDGCQRRRAVPAADWRGELARRRRVAQQSAQPGDSAS